MTLRLRTAALSAVAALAACARHPSPGPVTTAGSDSLAFEQFVADYTEGGRRGAPPRGDSLAWLHPYEESSDVEAAARSTALLFNLRRIDTTRLAVPQRIDWLLVESWLKRGVYDTTLHTAERNPGRYLTLGDLYWRVAGDRPPSAGDWSGVLRDLRRAPRVLATAAASCARPRRSGCDSRWPPRAVTRRSSRVSSTSA